MIKVFDTVSKKLAIPVLVFFTLGWAVYTAGFGLVLNIYFVSVGFILFYSRLFIQLQANTEPNINESLNLMFAGAMLLTVGWSVLQILVIFFNQPHQTQTKNWWSLAVGIYKLVAGSSTSDTSSPLLTCTDMVRLLSIPTVALSVVGWGVYVAGLYDYIQLLGSIATPITFAVWGSIFFTLFDCSSSSWIFRNFEYSPWNSCAHPKCIDNNYHWFCCYHLRSNSTLF